MSIGASVSCALRFVSLVGVRIRNLGPSERHIFSSRASSSLADCAPILGRFARFIHTLIRRQSSHSSVSLPMKPRVLTRSFDSESPQDSHSFGMGLSVERREKTPNMSVCHSHSSLVGVDQAHRPTSLHSKQK